MAEMSAAKRGRTSKYMSPEQVEHAREFLRRIVSRDFGGNERRAAFALKLSQSTVNEFLAGTRGCGPRVQEALATYAHVSIDQVLGRSQTLPSVTSGTPVLGNRPEFAEALTEARAAYPRISETVWSLIANSVIPGYRVTPDSLYDLARQIEPDADASHFETNIRDDRDGAEITRLFDRPKK